MVHLQFINRIFTYFLQRFSSSIFFSVVLRKFLLYILYVFLTSFYLLSFVTYSLLFFILIIKILDQETFLLFLWWLFWLIRLLFLFRLCVVTPNSVYIFTIPPLEFYICYNISGVWWYRPFVLELRLPRDFLMVVTNNFPLLNTTHVTECRH